MTKETFSIAASYFSHQQSKEIIVPLGTVQAEHWWDAHQQARKILIEDKGWDDSFVNHTVVILDQKGIVDLTTIKNK